MKDIYPRLDELEEEVTRLSRSVTLLSLALIALGLLIVLG